MHPIARLIPRDLRVDVSRFAAFIRASIPSADRGAQRRRVAYVYVPYGPVVYSDVIGYGAVYDVPPGASDAHTGAHVLDPEVHRPRSDLTGLAAYHDAGA